MTDVLGWRKVFAVIGPSTNTIVQPDMRSLSLMDIARAVDLPYPTAFRIIQTLIHEGLIECEPTRKHYRVTELVQSLSLGYQDGGKLVSAARPHIVELTRRFSWPVSVVTHVGQSMVVRDSTHTLTSLTFFNYSPGYLMRPNDRAFQHIAIIVSDMAGTTSKFPRPSASITTRRSSG